jgi:hypothetical protein
MLGSVFYNRNRRPQDVAWKWLYIASVLLSIVGGLYALTHRWGDVMTGRAYACRAGQLPALHECAVEDILST